MKSKLTQINNKTVFIPLNVKNRNGRIYTKENIEPHVQEFLQRKNQIGVCYGELEHPDTFDISLSKVSHTIENIWFEGNNLMGEIKPLNTHYGKILTDMLNSGVEFVVRPRSCGGVDLNGYVHLQKIFTFDILPLAQDAFFDNQKLRKEKLNKIAGLNETRNDYDDIVLPKLDDNFHIKNNFFIND